MPYLPYCHSTKLSWSHRVFIHHITSTKNFSFPKKFLYMHSEFSEIWFSYFSIPLYQMHPRLQNQLYSIKFCEWNFHVHFYKELPFNILNTSIERVFSMIFQLEFNLILISSINIVLSHKIEYTMTMIHFPNDQQKSDWSKKSVYYQINNPITLGRSY